MTLNEYRFFEIAKNISYFSDRKKVKIGCIIVHNNCIISSGYNTNKSHPIQKLYNKYRHFDNNDILTHALHAEISCILYLMNHNFEHFKKVKIFTYRENKHGDIRMSRPCEACMKLITELSIKHIYYTIYNGFKYERLF